MEKLRELKAAGIDTLVDLTVIGLGRYIPRIAAIAEQVPEINVVVATGVYTYNEVPMFFHFRGPGTILGGPEPMVDLFVREIEEGIGETGVRAGDPQVRVRPPGHHAGRRAGLAGGRPGPPRHRGADHDPHPDAARAVGTRAAAGLQGGGGGPARVVIGHSGGTVNTDYHLQLIDNGSYLGFDHFGLPGITLEERVDAVARLCERGYAERIVLSHDAMCFVDWFPRSVMDASADWRWTYICDDVLPAHARPRHQRGRHHDDARRQPSPDPRGRRRLLMRRVRPVLPRQPVRPVTLLQTELIAELAAVFPDAVAWRNLADGTDLTLRSGTGSPTDSPAGSAGWASNRGDRVALVIGNDEPLEWLVSYLAIHKAGAVAVPLLARLGPASCPAILRHAGASVALCSDGEPGVRPRFRRW